MQKDYRLTIIVLLHCIMLSMPSLVFAELSEEKHKQAIQLLEFNGIQHKDIYTVTRFLPYKNGGGLVSVQQLYKDLPVIDSEVAFHFDDDNRALRNADESIFKGGNEIPVDDLGVDIEPVIQSTQAADIAGEHSSGLDDANCLASNKKRVILLGIYKPADTKQLYLAWQATCKYRQTPSILVDAKTGQILRSLNSGETPIPAKQPIDYGSMFHGQNNSRD